MTQPRLLGGRYQVGDTLGYGGMAEVHHGRDVRLGREVAIKVLRADLARDPSFQARFRREAQAAAALNHPSIVAVYDTGDETPGTGPNGHAPYIVMEYVDGQTLRDVLKAEGRLHPQRAMEIAADICSALDFSHRTGIVHRDIKPGNVMITRAGTIKVMDFGIARAIADNAATMTATQAVIGTAQYLSPEQARGEPVDARSDVYSLGCLLYELLTGHPPFTGDSPVAVAYQHVRENATPPAQVNRDVPPALDAIVMKALAKNAMNRYQSAAEMRTDLLRAMAGRPVQAEPVMSDEERTTVLGGPIGPSSGAGLPSTYNTMDDEDRGNRRALAFVLLGLAVVAVFVVAALITMKLLKPDAAPSSVRVPSVLNLTEDAAKAKLQGQGFAVGTSIPQVVTNPAQVGRVLKQDPGVNEQVAQGATVTLTVGTAPATVKVPDVKQYTTYDAAAAALTGAQLKPTAAPVNSTQPEGTVLGSTPAAGTQVAPGTAVQVQVSNGKAGMPDVIGKSSQEAQLLLAQQGYANVSLQPLAPTDGTDFPSGSVWKTNPAKDTPITKDQQITLFTVPDKPVTPAPTITGVSPGSGPQAGGVEVTIQGTNLGSVSGVMFGDTAGTNLVHVNETTIKVTTPAHAAGQVAVTLVAPTGNVPLANGFTYEA
jgi:beta-lactam-binding protein with PASTA domain/tRNA A-37 threonylcarbamoyl transferase component Bud32